LGAHLPTTQEMLNE
jgi:hypothetical protein